MVMWSFFIEEKLLSIREKRKYSRSSLGDIIELTLCQSILGILVKVMRMDLEQIKNQVIDEYRKVLRQWELGRFYYRFKEYVRQFSRDHWINMIDYKIVCLVIAMSRVGVPITTSTLSWFSDKNIHVCRELIRTLVANKVLEPMGILEIDYRTTPRLYKLSPNFIKALYTGEIENE